MLYVPEITEQFKQYKRLKMSNVPVTSSENGQDVRKLSPRPLTKALDEFKQRQKFIFMSPARACTHEETRLKIACPDSRLEDDAYRVGKLSSEWKSLKVEQDYYRRQFKLNAERVLRKTPSDIGLLFEAFPELSNPLQNEVDALNKYIASSYPSGMEDKYKKLQKEATTILSELSDGFLKWIQDTVEFERAHPERFPTHKMLCQGLRYTYIRETLEPELNFIISNCGEWLDEFTNLENVRKEKQIELSQLRCHFKLFPSLIFGLITIRVILCLCT